MPLNEHEKQTLKEKYREFRRSTWGLSGKKRARSRRRTDATDEPIGSATGRSTDASSGTTDTSVPPDLADAKSPLVSILRQADDPAAPTDPVASSTRLGRTPPPSKRQTSDATFETPREEEERMEHRQGSFAASEKGVSASPRERDAREQIREKIKEHRRATWGIEESPPRLARPVRRKQEKAERQFWDGSAEQQGSGISIGVALLVLLAATGIVLLGVLLGYLLTVF